MSGVCLVQLYGVWCVVCVCLVHLYGVECMGCVACVCHVYSVECAWSVHVWYSWCVGSVLSGTLVWCGVCKVYVSDVGWVVVGSVCIWCVYDGCGVWHVWHLVCVCV
jgi:hypothetical protein